MEVHEFIYTSEHLHIQGEKLPKWFNLDDLSSISSSPDNQLQEIEAIRFIKDGYFCLESAIDIETINAARSYIDDNFKRWMSISKRHDDWRTHFQVDFRNDEYFDHPPILNLLLSSPKVLGRLNQLMGEVSNMFYSQVAFRTPLKKKPKKLGTVDGYIPGKDYHLDGTANLIGDRFPDLWTVNIGVALVDIPYTDMGNYTLFPGSHILRNWSTYPEEKKHNNLPNLGEPIKLCLKAGDVFFAHVLLAHRGGMNVHSSLPSSPHPHHTEEKRSEKCCDDDVPASSLSENPGDGLETASSSTSPTSTTTTFTSSSDSYSPRFIPKGTRELLFLRVSSSSSILPYPITSPQRGPSVLQNPFIEHESIFLSYPHLRSLVLESTCHPHN